MKLDHLDYRELFPTEKERAEAFDKIAKHYYEHNFGTFSKTESDTLMFHLFFEAVIRKLEDEDGLIDYSACSDYKIGRALGLTPARVRSLKLRKQLMYPEPDFDWKKSCIRLLADPKNLHVENNMLIVTVSDPNLFNAIRDAVEDLGGYVDISLNSRLLRVKQQSVLDLLELIGSEDDVKQLKKEIKQKIKEDKTLSERFGAILEKGDAGLSIAANLFDILKEIPGLGSGLKIASAVMGIIQAVKKL